MSRTHVSKALRRLIRERGAYRCAYCLTTEAITGMEMEVDHITPEVLGGRTDEDICVCLARHATSTMATERRVPMPTQVSRCRSSTRGINAGVIISRGADGIYIEGLTPAGRATISVLRLNRELLVLARQRWVSGGWHPPAE